MKKLIQILQDGEKLIQDCFRCYCYQRMGYANKIKALDAYLLRLFQVMCKSNSLATLWRFWPCSNQIDSVGITANRGVSDEYDNLGSCNAPGPPEFMMGLDVPLKELKRRLCEDGKSRIVIRAPRGCGKTTLAEGLCPDN